MIVQSGAGLAALALAALMLPGAASAGSTATRCDARGCMHIHCNSTGDRCYRYGDDDARRTCAGCADVGHAGKNAVGTGDEARRVCDSDGDRCYTSRAGHWNYREYYRRHGYRWDN